VLEAVPGRPELLSNSKLVLLSVPTRGLMASDISVGRFWGSVRVRVGRAIPEVVGVHERSRAASQG